MSKVFNLCCSFQSQGLASIRRICRITRATKIILRIAVLFFDFA